MSCSVHVLGAVVLACALVLQPDPAHAQADPTAAPDPATTAEPASEPAQVAEPAATPSPVAVVDCVEVELFKASSEKVDGQTDRAAQIPEKNLQIIQERLVRHLPKELRGMTAMAAGGAGCPVAEKAIVIGGDILDFRKGNMALRYFVGFGAGSQKVRVRLKVHAKVDGALIGESEIKDTKWGGVFGGTNTKGLDDFAEKAAEAAARAIQQRPVTGA